MQGRQATLDEMMPDFGHLEMKSVTPEYAGELLAKNYDRQRNISESRVASYVRDMKQGNWNSMAMAPLRVSSDDFLIDGQHRLRAVIESGVTVPMLVWYGGGNAEELFDDLDNPLVRKASHFVECKNKNVVLSISNMVKCLQSGAALGNALRRMVRQYRVNGKKTVEYLSRSEVVDFTNENLEKLVSAAEVAVKLRNVTYCTPSMSGTFLYLMREIDGPEVVDSYMSELMSTFPSERICTILQKTLMRKYATAKAAHGKVDNAWTMGLLAYGYELYSSGKQVKAVTGNACESAFQRLDVRIQGYMANNQHSSR